MGDLTTQIVAQATATPTGDALDVMKLSIIDWFACGIAGKAEPIAGVLAQMLDAEGGHGQATCFDGVRRPARSAALFNGAVSHALDYDDTHFAHIGHVSVGIVPAALALAERNDASVHDFIRACLAGCEAAVRMGIALGRDHYQIGFHQTATAGAFGATLAATLLDTPDASVQAHALGLASTRAAGLKSQFGTMGKPYNAGLAASTGVEAALLASTGMIADPDGWDGPQGFIKTHHGKGELAADGFFMPLVSHKFHACCHGLHATLEALATLLPLDATVVKEVHIATHPRWMSVCNASAPQTGLEAKFSYRAVTALTVLGYNTAALTTFDDHLIRDARIQALMKIVTVTEDATLTEMQVQVAVTTQDGVRHASYDLDVEQAITDRRDRIMTKASALIGAEKAARVAGLLEMPDARISLLANEFAA